MKIIDVREAPIRISRYEDPTIPSGGLDTSVVAIVTDVYVDGAPVVGYGFSSFGRYAQSGLIRQRLIPRLLAADHDTLLTPAGDNLEPKNAWRQMMKGEKPGGHGERCVAIGTLDMALWDAAAKIARKPLYAFLAEKVGLSTSPTPKALVYASGGYPYPADDIRRLQSEIRFYRSDGFDLVKVKIGSLKLEQERRRVDAVLEVMQSSSGVAIDAMNSYGHDDVFAALSAFEPLNLRWFEDICDPLDLDLLARAAERYKPPIAAGEALFSRAEAVLLNRFAGLRRQFDILVFDPVHCYGLSHYLEIISTLVKAGWPRCAFWPHGGHLYSLHITAALQLGGTEVNPTSFQPFGGLPPGCISDAGWATPPELPGIGLEAKTDLLSLLRSSLST